MGGKQLGNLLLMLSSIRGCQLQQIVRRAQQTPLTADLSNSPKQELAEAACKFDVPKNGFYGLLSQAIPAAMSGLAQALSHLLNPSTYIFLFLTIRCHVATYASLT
jgi:hypothetical protein